MNYREFTLLWVGVIFGMTGLSAEEQSYFCIKVVDEATGRGVPLVELETVNHIRYVTDSAGIIAFHEPGLMNQSVFFHVKSHGYEYPKDGFGYRGVRLDVKPGGEAALKLKRINIAQRLYRVTGAGIYRDSQLLGKPVPIKQPLLNGQVFGSDSVVNAIYRDRIYWFWGDTNRPSYPLGNFHVPGATSQSPQAGGLDPDVGVDLNYFVGQDGFAAPTAKMPGPGPTWIGGLVTIQEADRERLFATYVKVKPPLTVYQRGLAEFDPQTNRFEKRVEFDMESPLIPGGHPFQQKTADGLHIYFGNPFPLVRVAATAESLRDLSKYEAYTCLKEGSREDRFEVVRKNGAPVYAWKTNTIPFTPKLQAKLIKDGHLKFDEALFQLAGENDKPIQIHGGSVCWNEYRKRWIMIAVESFGTSLLGEVWYAEAEELVGPWRHARKIVSHDKYSFYNPKQHAMFDKLGGREIFFEGTYTTMFSGNNNPTPRYNYNQIMYKLDLSDPRLNLPAPGS